MAECNLAKDINVEEDMNSLRIICLLYKITPAAVRVKFDKEFHPSGGLKKSLDQHRHKVLEPLKRNRVINQTQWGILYPSSGSVSSKTFDLTLMICLIRHLTKIPVGDNLPVPSDVSEGADLSRLKYYRNKFAHHDCCSVTDTDFEANWNDICQAVVRLGGSKFDKLCNALKVRKLDDGDREVLIELRNHRIELKDFNAVFTLVPRALQRMYEDTVEDWKKEESKVFRTRALICLDDLLKTTNVIMAVGSAGCGKSIAIHHLALRLYKQEGYNILPVNSPQDIVQYYNPQCNQVFVIDDVCGKSTIDLDLVKSWTYSLPTVIKILKDDKVKILLSSRKHIYHDCRFQDLELLSSTVCDLVSQNYNLTIPERNEIARKYLTENEVNAIGKTGLLDRFSFFPLLCRLYSKEKFGSIQTFFGNPVSVITDDLRLMMKPTGQTTFATLILFIAYDNNLNATVFSEETSGIELVLKDISVHFSHISLFAVKSELQTLKLSYVREIDSNYTLIHDKIYDIFLSFCGEHLFDLVLKIAHTNVIRDRFIFESLQNENEKNEHVIKVPHEKELVYFERLLKDVRNGFVINVFRNINFKSYIFRTNIIHFLEAKVDMKNILFSISREEISHLLLSMTCQGYWDMVPIILTEHVNVNVSDWKGTPLYFASKNENLDIAILLLEHEADPNVKGCLGNESPLYAAVEKGNASLVKLLLTHNADPDAGFCGVYSHETPLHLAVSKDDISVIKLLITHKANINLITNTRLGVKRTPLHLAIKIGNTDLVKLLLEHNAYSNSFYHEQESSFCNAVNGCHTDIVKIQQGNNDSISICIHNEETPLFIACSQGHIDIVKLLLKYISNPNRCYSGKESPLFTAYSRGHDDIVKLLLEHNSNQKGFNASKELPLLIASNSGYTDIVKQLIEHNCDQAIFNNGEKSPLLAASAGGHSEIVKLLLEQNYHPDICNNNKETPVMIACRKDHNHIVKLLLKHNCDLNICNYCKESPLSIALSMGHNNIVNFLLEHISKHGEPNNSAASMCVASRWGHTDVVRLLLKNNCDPNRCNKKTLSPLFIASGKGHIEIVKLLLQYKCNPNICNKSNESALFIASMRGHFDIVKLLLQYKCDPSICNKSNESALFIASIWGHMDIVQLLLEHNCNPNICNKSNESALCIASMRGHINIVRLLLEHNCNPNICNGKNESPLFVASMLNIEHIRHDSSLYRPDMSNIFSISEYRYTEIMRLLLEHDCDPNICNDRHDTALSISSEAGHFYIVKLLLKYKCDPDLCNGSNETPLVIATSKGHIDIVKVLLEYNCNPNLCNKNNESPLFIASSKGLTDIVQLLLKYNCDYSICNDRNESPLFAATIRCSIDILKLLLEHKCDPNICNKSNESPLFIATMMCNIYSVKLLLDYNCDPNICNARNESPLFISADAGYTDIVKLLLEHNCDLNICTKKGESALCIASKEGHVDIVKLLLEHHCDPNICNDKKESPLFVASKRGLTDIVKLLLEHNCDLNICTKKGESALCIASKEGHVDIVKLLLEPPL